MKKQTVLVALAALTLVGLWPSTANAQEDIAPGVPHALDVCEVDPMAPGCEILTNAAMMALLDADDGVNTTTMADGFHLNSRGPIGSGEDINGLMGKSLSVSRFSQNGGLWKNDVMSTCGSTIGAEGCTLTSATMVSSYYGSGQTPKSMNSCLGSSACLLDWRAVPGCSNNTTVYRSGTSYSPSALKGLIDRGRPGIVKGYSSYGQHWVVVHRYDGEGVSANDFWIIDPWDGVEKRLTAYSNYQVIRVYSRRTAQ